MKTNKQNVPIVGRYICSMKNKQILIVGPSWVGDMVMAQVLFKSLKQNDPQIQIDVLAPNWSLDILQRMPEVRRSIALPIVHGELGILKRWRMAKELRKQKYDQAIVLANTWKSAVIPLLARIPVRTGWLGELRWGLLNDVRYLNKQKLPKMVQRYAALGFSAYAELPSILPTPSLNSHSESTESVLQKFSLKIDGPILALCPGAAYGPAKRWPEKYFSEVAQQKLSAGWQIWFFGSQQDVEVIENIRRDLNADTISFAGRINLLETVDLLSQASAVVTNDSGLLHIAASLDIPLVAIYGSTSPIFTPPLGVKSKVVSENLPCSPCFKRECPLKHFNCMLLIKPARVLAALDSLESL